MPDSRKRGARAPKASEAPICQVAMCPICTVVTATGQVRPEVVEHLIKAGMELMLAVKSVVDARTEGHGPARMEKIEVEE